MSKHTPGPWLHGTKDGYAANAVFAQNDDAICQVYGVPLHTSVADVLRLERYNEGVANARLISAAPDLLEALKDAEEMLRVYLLDANPVCVAARYAIAKAEGRS